jgi:hypothetical protein
LKQRSKRKPPSHDTESSRRQEPLPGELNVATTTDLAVLITGTEAVDILRAYHPQLVKWAAEVIGRRVRGLLRRRALAEIAPAVPGQVAEAFIMGARQGLVRATNLRGFLYTLTERAALRLVGERWRLDVRERAPIGTSDSLEPADDSPSLEAELISREAEQARAIARSRAAEIARTLPERDRLIVEGRFRDEPLTFRVLGAGLGITEQAARVAFFRAIRKLRASFAERRAA